MLIEVNKDLKTPVYRQIIQSILKGIDEGLLGIGSQLPSINQIASEYSIARETVVKAFHHLQEKGVLQSVHGKGFFVASDHLGVDHHVFILFDAFSAYKEVLYLAIKEAFGKKASIDIYFHHFNPKVFKQMVKDAVGNYTAYMILPFDDPTITEMLSPIPVEKLILLDRKPSAYTGVFNGIYQDFDQDIYQALSAAKDKLPKYNKLILVFRNLITEVPTELKDGFVRFCDDFKISYQVISNPLITCLLECNAAYIVIDDEDLVCVVENANRQQLKIGEDIGIISYNETSLKKVISNGISVISTDFAQMGRDACKMVLSSSLVCKPNPSSFIDRGSF